MIYRQRIDSLQDFTEYSSQMESRFKTARFERNTDEQGKSDRNKTSPTKQIHRTRNTPDIHDNKTTPTLLIKKCKVNDINTMM